MQSGNEELKNSADPANQKEAREQVFFPVSITKLIVLNTLFFGFYTLFWMFRNWKYLKEKQNQKCLPAVRAFFSLFFIFSLAPKMNRIIVENGGKGLSVPPIVLAIIFVVGALVGRIDQNNLLCTLLAVLLNVLPLVMLQREVNAVNGGEAAVTNKKFSKVNIGFAIFGALMWFLVIKSMLMPD